MGREVFISYASKEEKYAKQVCELIEQNGFTCWIAPRNIQPGAEYGEAIIQGIEQSKVVVLLFSKSSNESPHVLREVERAVSKKVPIIALKLEETPLSKSMEYFLLTNQWMDYADYKEELVPVIRSIIENGIHPDGMVTGDKDNASKIIQNNKKNNGLYIGIGIGSIAAVALCILFVANANKNKVSAVDSTISPTIQASDPTTIPQVPTDEPVVTIQLDENQDPENSPVPSEPTVVVTNLPSPTTTDVTSEPAPTQGKEPSNVTAAVPPSDVTTAVVPPSNEQDSKLQVGQYIKFGTYHPQGSDESADGTISWIVVSVDSTNNQAVLLSSDILDFKPFDSAESGTFHKDKKGNSYDREQKDSYSLKQMTEFYGSNVWESSNLRTWLNSDQARISYSDQAPVMKANDECANNYDKQAGFLYGFTNEEKARLCETSNTNCCNVLDCKDHKEDFEYKSGLISQPIDLSSYDSKVTKDKVYLLSLEEVKKYLYDNNMVIFAKPTEEAAQADGSGYYKTFQANGTDFAVWALRTPIVTDTTHIMTIETGLNSDVDFSSYYASASGLGIRPAVTISLDSMKLLGDGTKNNPYTIK